MLLNDNCRRNFLTMWQKYKYEEIKHPFSERKGRKGIVALCSGSAAGKVYQGRSGQLSCVYVEVILYDGSHHI